MTQQKIVSSYLRQVKRNCPISLQKKQMTDLESCLLDYLDDHPGSTYEDLVNHLGAPEKFADELILTMDEAARRKAIQKTRWAKLCCIFTAAVILLITAATAIGLIHAKLETRVYYYYEGITVDNN